MIQRTCDLENYGHSIFFSENLTYAPWSYSTSIDHIISEICNSSIGKVILIGDKTTLLDYKHQIIESLYVVDSKSQTRASSRWFLHRVLEYS